MDVQLEKLGLIEWITRITDNNILQKLVVMKEEHTATNGWSKEISATEIDSIKRGLENIEQGSVHSHESVKKIYERYI